MRRLLFLLLLWPAAGQGQATVNPATGPVRAPPFTVETVSVAPEPGAVRELASTPAGAFTASLVLPGAGQAALGLRRWSVYAVLEAGLWAGYLEAAADVRRLTAAYRDVAWEAARLPTDPGERQEGSWSYYETVGQYVTSGSYDSEPDRAGLQPEPDVTTYNGAVWSLALGIFLPGGTADPGAPEYEAALAYYRDRAAGPAFLWDWSGRLDSLDRYRGLIADADDEARFRSTALGLVLANHLVAAVDALIVARLRTGAGLRLESRLVPAPTPRLNVGLRISLRN